MSTGPSSSWSNLLCTFLSRVIRSGREGIQEERRRWCVTFLFQFTDGQEGIMTVFQTKNSGNRRSSSIRLTAKTGELNTGLPDLERQIFAYEVNP